ncbi:MmyB family transcriptional regulator, partial [Streptomyces fungicidicus]
WYTPRGPGASQAPAGGAHHARRFVADLRAAAGRRSGDPTVTGLVDRLRAASSDFRALWAEHEVAVRRADRKTFLHPRVGRLRMDCETLVTPDQRQQLLVLTPADAGARERLELLRVLGSEEFPLGAPGAPGP